MPANDQGWWRNVNPPRPKNPKHRCKPPNDLEVQAIAGEGSEWVCHECRRIWVVRSAGFWYGVSLYKTRHFAKGHVTLGRKSPA